MNFSDALASSIHDIKNSLAMVLNRLDQFTEDGDEVHCHADQIRVIKREASRANYDLIQLITLYKYEKEPFTANIAEYYLGDFFSELVAEHGALVNASSLTIEWSCDDDLSWYFDEDLLRGVLGSIIGNGIRYTRDRILLSAVIENDYLVIRIDDNGCGYPKMMLEAPANPHDENAFATGRTGLGLYFAKLIAELHVNRGRQGFIRLENGGDLGGGCFMIFLP